MPIEQERLLRLLEAGEDALAGLKNAESIVGRESRLVKENLISPEDALGNLQLMLTVEGLLEHGVETQVTIERERLHMSPRRMKENDRKRARQQRLRRDSSDEQ